MFEVLKDKIQKSESKKLSEEALNLMCESYSDDEDMDDDFLGDEDIDDAEIDKLIDEIPEDDEEVLDEQETFINSFINQGTPAHYQSSDFTAISEGDEADYNDVRKVGNDEAPVAYEGEDLDLTV